VNLNFIEAERRFLNTVDDLEHLPAATLGDHKQVVRRSGGPPQGHREERHPLFHATDDCCPAAIMNGTVTVTKAPDPQVLVGDGSSSRSKCDRGVRRDTSPERTKAFGVGVATHEALVSLGASLWPLARMLSRNEPNQGCAPPHIESRCFVKEKHGRDGAIVLVFGRSGRRY
jgi:hypothetical protein